MMLDKLRDIFISGKSNVKKVLSPSIFAREGEFARNLFVFSSPNTGQEINEY